MKPPRRDSKTAAVLRALHRSAGLTAASAFALGETHLAGTVLRLRRGGHYIEAVWQTGTSRYGGRPIRYKKYFAPLNQK